MHPKPTGEGDRPITRTQSLYRVWSRLRKDPISQWEKSRAGFWGAAVKGSGLLRAALLRLARAEIASWMNCDLSLVLLGAE
eukprot:5408877-Pyramimonas_sp.AAC.1